MQLLIYLTTDKEEGKSKEREEQLHCQCIRIFLLLSLVLPALITLFFSFSPCEKHYIYFIKLEVPLQMKWHTIQCSDQIESSK